MEALDSHEHELKMRMTGDAPGTFWRRAICKLSSKVTDMTNTLHATDDRHLFIVRVWREDSRVAPGGQWRGSVEHVPSGQRIHFVSLEALTEFVSQYWGGDGSHSATTLSDQ